MRNKEAIALRIMFGITKSGYIGLLAALCCGVWIAAVQRPQGGIDGLYEEWRNALHVGGAYFLYQVVDDVPHLIAGHAPGAVRGKPGERNGTAEISRKDIPAIMFGRAVNHLFRALFVVVLAKVVLDLANR